MFKNVSGHIPDKVPQTEHLNSEGLVYLASPYSVVQPISQQQAIILRDRRYRKVVRLAARLMKEGHLVFCPIAHSHPIEVIGMPGELQSGDFWLRQDFAILQGCKHIWVFKMDGWEKSSGVARELAFAKEHNIPVDFIEEVPEKGLFKRGGATKR